MSFSETPYTSWSGVHHLVQTVQLSCWSGVHSLVQTVQLSCWSGVHHLVQTVPPVSLRDPFVPTFLVVALKVYIIMPIQFHVSREGPPDCKAVNFFFDMSYLPIFSSPSHYFLYLLFLCQDFCFIFMVVSRVFAIVCYDSCVIASLMSFIYIIYILI